MEYWESPLEHLQTKPTAESYQKRGDTSREPSRKRKDSFASQATPSPVRHSLHQDGDSDELQSSSAAQDPDELVTYHLESIGTGSTKRESKHRASAKMLAMLFPECSSMIEVKAAAECARQCYAAKKVLAQTKRAKLSNERSIQCEKSNFSPALVMSTKNQEQNDHHNKGKITQPTSDKKAPSSPHSSDIDNPGLESLSEGFVSVAGLSLSEPTNEYKRIKWSEAVGDREVFENEMNGTLKLLHGKAIGEEAPGRMLLRLANLDDFECICALLNKLPATNFPPRTTMEQKYCDTIDVTDDSKINSPKTANSPDSIFSVDQQGSLVKIVLLTQAALDEPPLGVSLLSIANDVTGRTLSVHVLKHEEHLPQERFIECLDELANAMNCNLISSIVQDELSNIISFVYDQMSDSLSPEKISESYGDSEDHPLTSSHLQSVQEEDSEDADGSEEDEGNDLSGRKRSRVD
jgi:hypothetical protein